MVCDSTHLTGKFSGGDRHLGSLSEACYTRQTAMSSAGNAFFGSSCGPWFTDVVSSKRHAIHTLTNILKESFLCSSMPTYASTRLAFIVPIDALTMPVPWNGIKHQTPNS